MAAVAIAGSVVDSMFVFPTLFPGPESQVGKLDSMNVMRTEDGSPVNYAFGQERIRVGSKPIWLGEVFEVEQESSAGKGGSVTNFVYRQSAAFAYSARPIQDLLRVTADGEEIWNRFSDVDVTGSVHFGALGGSPSLLAVLSCAGGMNDELEKLRAGRDLTITGHSVSANNGTFKVEDIEFDGNQYFVTIRNDFPTLETAPSESITITQTNGARKSGVSGQDIWHDGIGNIVDATIEGEEGVGEVPTWDGHVLHSFYRLRLTENFANRIPNIEAEFQPDASCYADDVLTELMEISGLTASRWDVSAVTGSGPIRGYNVVADQEMARPLQPLMLAFDLFSHELNGKLTFYPRADIPQVTVPSSDVIGDIEVRPVKANDIAGEVVLSFLDANDDLASRTVRAGVPENQHASPLKVNIPISMTEAEAQVIADRLHSRMHTDRHEYEFDLPPQYLVLESNDLLRVETERDGTLTMMVKSKDDGANGLIRVVGAEARSFDVEAAQ